MRHTQDFAEFFFKERIFGFMYNDLDQAINSARVYFLVALGLSAYTEFMGSLVTGHLKDSRWSKKNYRAFLPYLGPHYVNLDKQIDLYKRVRCGLVHEYFVKGPSMISRKSTDKNIRGIIYTPIHDHITLYIKSYFQDFKAGVQKYYDILMAGDVEALRKFKKAVM
jgi:hypothetical protein